ncbi:hypothetical protein MKEN_00977000 [Mycena kentingensis (nom. inval.)]|nr:hypothetical protein MKEN_00977000 [Mycena kentingensis (nom. inval.)]
MGKWPVFVTAPRISLQALNRVLLLLLDYDLNEYHTDPLKHDWILLTSDQLPPFEIDPEMDIYDLPDSVKAKQLRVTPLPLTGPEVFTSTNNAFASWSPSRVRGFVDAPFTKERFRAHGISPRDYIVIDQHGLETSTALLCRTYQGLEFSGDFEEIPPGDDETGVRVRMPYEAMNGMMANLSIGHMAFEAWVDLDRGLQDEGSWRWQSFAPQGLDRAEYVGARNAEGTRLRREMTLKWREAGLV